MSSCRHHYLSQVGEIKEGSGASKPGVRATSEARGTVDLPRGSRSHGEEAAAARAGRRAW